MRALTARTAPLNRIVSGAGMTTHSAIRDEPRCVYRTPRRSFNRAFGFDQHPAQPLDLAQEVGDASHLALGGDRRAGVYPRALGPPREYGCRTPTRNPKSRQSLMHGSRTALLQAA
jgi:hypothetical protein